MTLNISSSTELSDQQVPPVNRFAPLSGVAFFVLLMASAVIAGETPGGMDSGARVHSLFKAHEGAEKVSNLLAALSVVFLVFFAACCASIWCRKARERSPLPCSAVQ